MSNRLWENQFNTWHYFSVVFTCLLFDLTSLPIQHVFISLLENSTICSPCYSSVILAFFFLSFFWGWVGVLIFTVFFTSE